MERTEEAIELQHLVFDEKRSSQRSCKADDKESRVDSSRCVIVVNVVSDESFEERSLKHEQRMKTNDENIEDFLPSRLAACDGSRTISLRRRKSSRRRRPALTGSDRSRDDGSERDHVMASSCEMSADMMDSSVTNSLMPNDDEMVLDQLGSIKFYATTMEKKRKMRDELLTSKVQMLDGYKKLKADLEKGWRRKRQHVSDISQNLQVWKGSFKRIEGSFGASVLSYFEFIKSLFFINLFMAFMIIVVIILPHVFFNTFNFIQKNCFHDNSSDEFLAEVCSRSNEYETYVNEIQGNSSSSQLIADILLGTGWLELSYLFIGFYSNDVNSIRQFDMAVSYLLTTAVYFIVILAFMVIYTGRGIKERILRHRDEISNIFEKVFCGWNYSLVKEFTAKEKQKSIFKELIVIYESWLKRQNRHLMSKSEKCCLYGKRFVVNFFVVLLLIGSGAIIVITVKRTPELQNRTYVQKRDFLNLFVSLLPSIVITILNLTLPIIFQKVVKLENYSDEVRLQMTLIRTVFLRLASIAVLVVTIAIQVNQCENSNKALCQIQHSFTFTCCWETYMGQQLYKLVILDFLIVILVILLHDFPRNYLVGRFPNSCLARLLERQEFDVPQNVIDITYTQSLCWIGAFFSPLIPVITALKLIIFFIAKQVTLIFNYKPQPSRASRTTYFFMIILMITFLLCSAAIAYAIGRLPPSKSCGPFRVYSEKTYYMYYSVTDAIQSLPSVALQRIFFFFGSWMFFLTVVIVFSLIILYYRSIARANCEMERILKHQFTASRSDKIYLLDKLKEYRQRN